MPVLPASSNHEPPTPKLAPSAHADVHANDTAPTSDERRQGCSIRASSRHHAAEKFSRLVEEELKAEAQDLRSCDTDAHGSESGNLPRDHIEAVVSHVRVPAFL